jgi:hypothetical protein
MAMAASLSGVIRDGGRVAVWPRAEEHQGPRHAAEHAEWKMSLLREGHRPDDPSLCGTVIVEEPCRAPAVATGVGPFGQSSGTSGRRPSAFPSPGPPPQMRITTP